jgi:hypothetical protein
MPTNTFVSAVGPTLQSSSSAPINAQIFYARNINGFSGTDHVTVTFTGPMTGSPTVSGGAGIARGQTELAPFFPLCAKGHPHNC